MQVRVRRPRHSRVPIAEHRLSPRDIAILKQLHHYRLLSTRQLALHFATGTVVRNLRVLYHNGYIDKPQAQRFFRNRPSVYALADRGAALLAELGYPRGLRDHSAQNHALRPWTLPHYLLIAETTLVLERSCRGRADVQLVHADELKAPGSALGRIEPIRLEVMQEEDEQPAISIIPDAMVVLVQNGQPKLLFIEADCASEPLVRSDPALASIARKLRTYRDYARAKGSQRQFGINNFRTLFVTSGSPERVRAFVETEQALAEGQGSTRFLFTTEVALAAEDLLEEPLVNGRGELVRLAYVKADRNLPRSAEAKFPSLGFR